jgi:uncharacterized membrane protein
MVPQVDGDATRAVAVAAVRATDPAETAAPIGGRTSGCVLLLCGIVGLVASIALTVEDFAKIRDPSYIPSCSINPYISCGQVMSSHQASVFGFPNPLLGLPTFAVVVAIALLAVAGVRLPRWVWVGLTSVSALGVGFVCWLIFQTLYRINALCPYCTAVWVVTPIAAATAFHQALLGANGILRLVADWRWTLAVVFYAVVGMMVFLRFEDYWLSLL